MRFAHLKLALLAPNVSVISASSTSCSAVRTKDETECAAAELAEARRLSSDGRFSNIARVKAACHHFGVPAIRALPAPARNSSSPRQKRFTDEAISWLEKARHATSEHPGIRALLAAAYAIIRDHMFRRPAQSRHAGGMIATLVDKGDVHRSLDFDAGSGSAEPTGRETYHG
jgi:hypothetical protein